MPCHAMPYNAMQMQMHQAGRRPCRGQDMRAQGRGRRTLSVTTDWPDWPACQCLLDLLGRTLKRWPWSPHRLNPKHRRGQMDAVNRRRLGDEKEKRRARRNLALPRMDGPSRRAKPRSNSRCSCGVRPPGLETRLYPGNSGAEICLAVPPPIRPLDLPPASWMVGRVPTHWSCSTSLLQET